MAIDSALKHIVCFLLLMMLVGWTTLFETGIPEMNRPLAATEMLIAG